MGIDDLIGERKAEIATIARKHGARNLRVFGSAARADARADSDLDLLVEMETDRSLLDLIDLEHELQALLGRPVDVVTEAGLSPYLRESILQEALFL
jgi:uncharacterized protein